jgi:hopanoid biosynthesis associated protein HpnK
VTGLIVTADDFGAAMEVNEAVEISHRRGILTAASLMVAGPAAGDAIARARRLTSLGVGLHLVLVDGRPASQPSSIPDLVQPNGLFRTDMVKFGAEIFLQRNVRRQVAAEITAQFEAFQATGLTLDHVNAHKHFHLHPTISGLILEIGPRFGMRAVRVPSEPRAVLGLAEPQIRPRSNYLISPWLRALRLKLQQADLLVPQSVFGLAWSGAMVARRLDALLRCLPQGLNEIYLHPATSDRFDGAVPGYRYLEELGALIAPNIVEAARSAPFRRGGYADFDVVRACA